MKYIIEYELKTANGWEFNRVAGYTSIEEFVAQHRRYFDVHAIRIVDVLGDNSGDDDDGGDGDETVITIDPSDFMRMVMQQRATQAAGRN